MAQPTENSLDRPPYGGSLTTGEWIVAMRRTRFAIRLEIRIMQIAALLVGVWMILAGGILSLEDSFSTPEISTLVVGALLLWVAHLAAKRGEAAYH
ncbi:MAG: hypothetical protein B7Z66_07825 [Chromatiales bacterium 21-64-14]|nr:MAG: hypothetical protein B7Z66_07825 [Chromatiales bacterium 21-64-14]